MNIIINSRQFLSPNISFKYLKDARKKTIVKLIGCVPLLDD